MTGAALGRDENEAEDRLSLIRERKGTGDISYEFKGSPDQVVDQMVRYAEAGVDRILVQLLLHDDLEQIEIIGRDLIPALR
ncbi:MAG: hypothetical protein M3Y45_02305 [Actinomycetota bacterium]|nr:hypothetical protein [Actinomycetota bacterium]